MNDARDIYSRRGFLARSASCAAHVGLVSAGAPLLRLGSWAPQERFRVVASEPWGRLERVAEGVWSLVSDPLTDRTTLCNGGIVAGRAGVVVIESFGSDAGARWMAAEAERLAGRPPTHVVLTHYHGDHTGGLRGSAETPGVEILATRRTLDLVRERANGPPVDVLDGAGWLEGDRPTTLDLGDRALTIVPRRGHTDSDVTIELYEPSIVFCGDLLWNGMFPNYVDAIPSRLSQAVRLLRRSEPTTYLSGHGATADNAAIDLYLDLLDDVEAAARRAMERGKTAEEAGAEYALPAGTEEWTLFNPGYFTRAIGAWMREIEAK